MRDGRYEAAYAQFEKIAAAGLSEAFEQAADLILKGQVAREMEEAEMLVRKALSQGRTNAVSRMVDLLVHHPEHRDLGRAMEFVREWAATDATAVGVYVEKLFATGRWPVVDLAGAKEWLELASASGSILCQCLLGVIHEEGLDGVAVDDTKALGAYESVIPKGHSRAFSRIGMVHLKRWRNASRDSDLALAIEWFERGVSAKDVGSVMQLSHLFEVGHYSDRARLIAGLKLAVLDGVDSAARLLDRLDPKAAVETRKTRGAPILDKSVLFGVWRGALGANATLEVILGVSHSNRGTIRYRIFGADLSRELTEVQEAMLVLPGLELGWMQIAFEDDLLVAFHRYSRHRAVLEKDGEDDVSLDPVLRLPGRWTGKWQEKWPMEIVLRADRLGGNSMQGTYSYLRRLSDRGMRKSDIRGVYRGWGASVVGGFHGLRNFRLDLDREDSDLMRAKLGKIMPLEFAAELGSIPKEELILRRVENEQ